MRPIRNICATFEGWDTVLMAKMLRISDTFGAALRHSAAMITLVAPIAASDLGVKLESAIHREVVMGDLKGAIEQYRSIEADPAATRPIAAKAWLHMAQCFEKSGEIAAAGRAYARVLKEFAEEPESAAARTSLDSMKRSQGTSGSGPRNLKFELGSVGKAPPGWIVPELPQVADHWAEIRNSGCREGMRCAVLLIPDNAPGFGYLMQTFSAAQYRGKTVRLRAWMKIEAGNSYDHAQMSLSVDRDKGRLGFYDDLNDRPVQSAEWTMREITTRVYDDATFITVGAISKGRGRVWLDDASFEIVK
jgi:hypothetical protein